MPRWIIQRDKDDEENVAYPKLYFRDTLSAVKYLIEERAKEAQPSKWSDRDWDNWKKQNLNEEEYKDEKMVEKNERFLEEEVL